MFLCKSDIIFKASLELYKKFGEILLNIPNVCDDFKVQSIQRTVSTWYYALHTDVV